MEAVIAKELSLLQPGLRSRPDAVVELLHDDFREFGASGRVWDRASIVDALASDPGPGAVADDVNAVPLGDDAVLVTYVARNPQRVSLRSSVWVRSGGRWRILFHQGTAVPMSTEDLRNPLPKNG